jgi:hypothetical protein
MAADVPAVRMALHRAATVPASADELWSLVTDWAGMSRWHLTAEDGGLRGPTLASCELVGAPHEVPRTRRMLLARFEAVYDAMCRGFQRYFAEHGAARGRPS